jgi:UDP-hydrolysing UDP-N-acetyl-D-glucosamine 2-epimerase
MTIRVCAVTGTRAEYGLLQPVIAALGDEPDLELQVVVTGSHLSPEFGRTVEEIEADGTTIDDRVEMLLSSDSAVGVTKSLGLAVIGFADTFERLRPDLVVVLGDRYEILAVAQAALVARIPVVHLSGGDVTEGAIDDAMRHAITKLSHLHLVFSETSAARVRQMGEDPERVIVTGSPGLDELVAWRPEPRRELEDALGLRLRARNLLVTYHPVTLAEEPAVPAFTELLAALDGLGDDVGLILTSPNADTHGRELIEMTNAFADAHDNAVAHASLGRQRYYSCLHTVDAVVGNSSSGLSEAPAVGVATVDIGERQRGRLRAPGTISCPPERGAIAAAIAKALDPASARPTGSPYGDGHAVPRIVAALRAVNDPQQLLQKRFHPFK